MPVSDFLKEYMLKNGYTKADISRMSNIPYTTIDGLFKKGDENTKLSTLKKLAELIGCTIDDMAYNDGSDNNNTKAPSITLTKQEETHIKKYRQLSDVRRYVVDEVLDAQYQKQMEEQSAEKEEQRLG